MTKIRDLHADWMKDSDYRAEYERLEPEFELSIAIIKSRIKDVYQAIDTQIRECSVPRSHHDHGS